MIPISDIRHGEQRSKHVMESIIENVQKHNNTFYGLRRLLNITRMYVCPFLGACPRKREKITFHMAQKDNMTKRANSIRSDKNVTMKKADPLYLKVADHIHQCILQGVLSKRTVITEASISRMFKISRTPVRQALTRLEKAGLIRHRKTRGYVVGKDENGDELKLIPDMLQLPSGHSFLIPTEEWERIYDQIENEIIRLSILSSWHLNALELAKSYEASRRTIHEILSRMEVTGLVERNYRSRWTIVPLDEKRLDAIFDVRSWLEPNLLAQAMPKIPKSMLEQVIERHKSALLRYPDARAAELNQLEVDMHEKLLQYADNPVAMVALKTAKAGLISSKHIVGSEEVPLGNDDPFLEEHLSILESIYRQNTDESRLRLQAHLLKSRHKVRARLRRFREVIEIIPTKFVKRLKD
jgi:DNA-binding GntR family transcriptional regulator